MSECERNEFFLKICAIQKQFIIIIIIMNTIYHLSWRLPISRPIVISHTLVDVCRR